MGRALLSGHIGAAERAEQALRRDGYRQVFALMYSDDCAPRELLPKSGESGWETRRNIKAWCARNGFTEYRIVRSLGYVKDLHGPVYELWEKHKPWLTT